MKYLKNYTSNADFKQALTDGLEKHSICSVYGTNQKTVFVDDYDERDKRVLKLIELGYNDCDLLAQRIIQMSLGTIPSDLLFDINGDGIVDTADAVNVINRRNLFPEIEYYKLEGNICTILGLRRSNQGGSLLPRTVDNVYSYYLELEPDWSIASMVCNGTEYQPVYTETTKVKKYVADVKCCTINANKWGEQGEDNWTEVDFYIRLRYIVGTGKLFVEPKIFEKDTTTELNISNYDEFEEFTNNVVNSLQLNIA